jgi:hypothetical protein
MTPLEAVREIQRMTQAVHDNSLCLYCMDSDRDCAWKKVPQIVLSLEAAEAVLWAADDEAGLRLSDVFPRDFVIALADLEIALSDEGKC